MATSTEQIVARAQRKCPFCSQYFQGLGKHLQHCKDRQGRDYSQYLSQKTLQKKTKRKEICSSAKKPSLGWTPNSQTLMLPASCEDRNKAILERIWFLGLQLEAPSAELNNNLLTRGIYDNTLVDTLKQHTNQPVSAQHYQLVTAVVRHDSQGAKVPLPHH